MKFFSIPAFAADGPQVGTNPGDGALSGSAISASPPGGSFQAAAPPAPGGQPKGATPWRAGLQACPKSSPGAPAPTGNCTWYDPANPDPLHQQNVTYDKANESVQLLLRYTDEKLTTLKTLSQSTDTDADTRLVSALGTFCVTDPATHQPESGATCFARWERFTLLNMERMRAAIIRNDTSNANLMSKQKNKDTNVVTGADVPSNQILLPEGSPPPANKPILTYLPSYTELQEMYGSHNAGDPKVRAAQVSNQVSAWLGNKDGYAAPPDKKDFPSFKKILRDPDNPSAGYFSVVDLEADGKTPKTDQEAYKAAMTAYSQGRPGGNVLQDDAKKLMMDKYGTTKIGAQLLRGKSADPTGYDASKKTVNQSKDSIDRQAFGQSRWELGNPDTSALATPTRGLSGNKSQSQSVKGGFGTGSSSSKAADTTLKAPPNGDEVIKSNSAAKSGETYTIRLPLHAIEQNIIDNIQKDVAPRPADGAPPPAVELPPMVDD